MKLFHKLNGKWLEVTSNNGGGSNSDINLPEGGSDGYLLSKLGDNLSWTNPENVGFKLPEDGNTGQALLCDTSKEDKVKWGLIQAPHNMNIGDIGYTLANTPPSNCLFLENQLLNKDEYPELYSVIGNNLLDDTLISSSKLMVPVYNSSEYGTLVSNLTSDLTLGNDSYYSAVLDNKIKVTTIGYKGAIQSTVFYGWSVFNDDEYVSSSQVPNQLWGTNSSYDATLEIEYLDGSKFAPYSYGIKRWIGDYNGYYFGAWELTGWNEETSTWNVLDSHTNGSSSNPSVSSLQLYKVQTYDNNKTYSKFRFNFTNVSQSIYISRLRLYGTKEGESSIYDMFALPEGKVDINNAKPYIVATPGNDKDYNYTEEERVIGTWINGKPIYRKVIETTLPTSANITAQVDISDISLEKLVKIDSIANEVGKYYLQIPNSVSGDIYITIGISNNVVNINCGNSYWLGKPLTIILEYTKTTD